MTNEDWDAEFRRDDNDEYYEGIREEIEREKRGE